MTDELQWGDVSKDENVSEKDIKNAEAGSKPPIGQYICTVEESKPKQRNPKDKPSYFVANLKMRIDEVIQLDGKPVSGDEGEQYEGRFIFDSISLSRDDEPDALRNRRILVAKRGGIITGSSTKIPANTWSELIIGKRFLITYIEEQYEDFKTKQMKTARKVAFDGFDVPDRAVRVTEDDLDDI